MKLRIVLLFALLTASLSVASPVGATPTPPVIVVNHSTRQCAQMIEGDDCHWCDPLDGWEVLGDSRRFTCPAGYEDIGSQGMTGKCRGYKKQFCCSSGSHHGDCEDLIINESEQLCAFVEEIRGCTLPDGWTSAGDTTQWSGRCPIESQWVSDITCVATPQAAEPTATAHTATSTRTTMTTPSPTMTLEPPLETDFRPGIVWGSAIALGGLFAAVLWLILRRLQRR